MHQVRDIRPNGFTITGALAMGSGGMLYLADNAMAVGRKWPFLLWPALVLMAIGVVLSFIGAAVGEPQRRPR